MENNDCNYCSGKNQVVNETEEKVCLLKECPSEREYDSFPKALHCTPDIDHIPINSKHGQQSYLRFIVPAEIAVVFFVIAKVIVAVSLSQYIRLRFFLQYGDNDSIAHNFSFCTANRTDPEYILNTKIQQETSKLMLHLSVTEGVPTAIMSVIFGAYSDYIGRKVLFLIPMIGLLIQSLTYGMISYFNASLSYFYIPSVFNGLCGGFVTFVLACIAMAADVTSASRARTFHIAFVESIGYTVIGIGELCLGYMIKYVGFSITYFITTGISAFSIIFIVIFVKDSVKRPRTVFTNLPSFKVLLYNIFHFYLVNENGRRVAFILSFVILLMLFLSSLGTAGIFVLFLLGRPACWDSVRIGQYLAVLVIAQSIPSIIFIKLAQSWLKDTHMAIICILSFIGQLLLIALAKYRVFYFIAIGVGCLGIGSTALIRSVMSKMARHGEHGSLFASVASLEAIMTMLASLLTNFIYQNTVAIFSGFVFIVLSMIAFVGIIFIIILEVIMRRHKLYKTCTKVIDVIPPS